MENTTRYFFLTKTANECEYTLWRTFLQEAYLTADYERRKLSITGCYPITRCSQMEGAQQDIIPILYPGLHQPESAHGIKAGALTSIILDRIVESVCNALVLFYINRRRRRHLKSDLKAGMDGQ